MKNKIANILKKLDMERKIEDTKNIDKATKNTKKNKNNIE
jgi:hypothetical protein